MYMCMCTVTCCTVLYTKLFSVSGAFCKVHSAVLLSEETGYLIEKQVAVKHLKGKWKLYLLAELAYLSASFLSSSQFPFEEPLNVCEFNLYVCEFNLYVGEEPLNVVPFQWFLSVNSILVGNIADYILGWSQHNFLFLHS